MAGLQPLTIDQGLIQAAGNRRVQIQKLNFGPLITTTVSGGSITATSSFHFLTNPGFFTANVYNIYGGAEGDILILGGDRVRLRAGGNLQIQSNFYMTTGATIMLIYAGSAWYELCRNS